MTLSYVDNEYVSFKLGCLLTLPQGTCDFLTFLTTGSLSEHHIVSFILIFAYFIGVKPTFFPFVSIVKLEVISSFWELANTY